MLKNKITLTAAALASMLVLPGCVLSAGAIGAAMIATGGLIVDSEQAIIRAKELKDQRLEEFKRGLKTVPVPAGKGT